MKTYNTVAIQTDINGVDSNEELTALFAKALELCQTAKTSEEICCSSSSSTQYLSCENETESKTIKAEMDYNECLESMQTVCAQIKQEITDAREEALENHSSSIAVCELHVDEEEGHSVVGDQDMMNKIMEETTNLEKHPATVQDNLYSIQQERNTDQRTKKKQSIKKQHICPYCNKECQHGGNLKVHIRIHTNERPFQCQHCGKAFATAGTLNVHIRRHLGIKPYKCSFCEQSFVEKSNLVKHLRTHTGERPYKCDFCDKAFRSKANLIGHLRTHTGEKPHKCDICDKGFIEKFSLDVHLLSHTGERPHKCEICDKTFKVRPTLFQHLGTHSGERPHKCQICDKSFTRKAHVIRHLQTHVAE